MPPPEKIAGRYRVERAVGRGGMGEVWLCHDEVLGRDVAVKQVGRLPGESLTDSARALREARSSANLNHRNVVSVFDVVQDAGEIWLVMEYVPSRTLSQVIREDGALPPKRVARIGAQVAAGLAAAHEIGVTHRDVKPGNVLVGDHDVAKVSDFGIARRTGDLQLTQTGLLTGTPAYFSPELARGGDPTPAADVWALGATLYAAVEGRSPYPDERNALALLQVIATSPPPTPTRAGVLTDPLRRMLDPDPDARWTMADAAHALRRLADRQVEGGTARLPAAATGAGTGAAAGAAAGAGASGPPPARPAAPRRAEPPTASGQDRGSGRRGRAALWVLAVAAVLLLVAGAGYALLTDDSGTPSADPGTTASSSPSRPDSTTDDSDEDSGGTEQPAPQDPDTPAPSPDDAEQSMTGFVQSYFDTVPEDTDRGWKLLAPSMQSVGRDDYESFWRSVDEVTVGRAQPVSDDAVEVVLTYDFADGRVVTERQRITLQPNGGTYLIVDDEVLTSRTTSG